MNVPEITQKECGEVDRVTGGAHDRTDLQQLACGPRHLTNFLSGLQQLDAHDYTELLYRIERVQRIDGANRNDCLHHPVGSSTIPHPPRAQCHSDSSSNALSDSSDSDAISDSNVLFFDDEGYECSEKWRQWLIERQMGGYCEHDPGPFPTPFSDSDDMESDEDFGEEELRS